MATVFMRWLERSPDDYDRGIRLLTVGRLDALHESFCRGYVRPGMSILEIGCGTGGLAIRMAAGGAGVSAVDSSAEMLAVARRRIAEHDLSDDVVLHHLDAGALESRFEPASFDMAVCSLVLSELPDDIQRSVVASCAGLLAPGGFLMVIDETEPDSRISRTAYHAVRLPLTIITWFLTRTTSRPLIGLEELATTSGCSAHKLRSELRGSLALWAVGPTASGDIRRPQPTRLRHATSLRTVALDSYELLFRVVPPYPNISPGLYAIGAPDTKSAVLVTGNYDLTVRRLLRELDGLVDAWLLVVDSSGINVWCAAGGGFLTAEKVIGAVRSADLEQVVEHRALILPQLCANGVDGWKVRRELGWGVHWGPIRATDIPAYLAAGRRKTDAMRHVGFPLRDRLEMVTATLGLYALLILVPVALLWRNMFWPVAIAMVGLSYFYAVCLPWLPGRDGLAKSVPLAVIAWLGMIGYSLAANEVSGQVIFARTIGVTALSVFVAAELQGMSPRMRGEQANWLWEVAIFVTILAIYLVVPLLLGWD